MDALLWAALDHRVTRIRLEPREPVGQDGGYRVTLLRHQRELMVTHLDGGSAAGLVDRLAIMARIDLSYSRGCSGRFTAACRELRRELFVSIEEQEHGMLADVLVVARRNEHGQTINRDDEILPVGYRVGPHRIERVLGRGGMGRVYLARHELLGARVAIKVVHRQLLQRQPAAASQFLREARATASLRHPGIVRVWDVDELEDGRPYLVMDYLSGASLRRLLRREGALDIGRAVRLARQVAGGLGAAHRAGVMHFDVSPANVFVIPSGSDERGVLIDFGAAHVNSENCTTSDEEDERILGTPCYIAPERIRGRGGDCRSDLYSLGVMMHEMIAGELPFLGANVREVALLHLKAAPPRLESPSQAVPKGLRRIVRRLMEKEPDARFASAEELDAALETVERRLQPWWKRLKPPSRESRP